MEEEEWSNFEAFYRLVFAGSTAQQQRWHAALGMMRRPLPLVVRAMPALAADAVLQRTALAKHLADATHSVAVEASAAGEPRPCLTWLPQWKAWEVKRSTSQWESWRELTQLLFRAQATAECAVQELVSMIPVLLLDPRVSDFICDLCAAPGSKTSQILERLSNYKNSNTCNGGFLIANELDEKRVEALSSRVQHGMGSSASSCIVTCCNAAAFPTLHICERILEKDEAAVRPHLGESMEVVRDALRHEEYASSVRYYQSHNSQTTMESPAKQMVPWYRRRKLKFHRILVDAPCSGDGTGRKNQDVLASWSATRGLGNFARQLAILRRALEILREGGRCVYSTCSPNPVECEAVVAAAVALHNATKATQGGGVAFLEDSHALLAKCLPGIAPEAFDHGLSDWPVPAPSFSCESPVVFHSWDEVPTSLRAKRAKVRTAEATEPKQNNDGAAVGVRLRREMFAEFAKEASIDTSCCMRILPGSNVDSGCFFAAVIGKAVEGLGTSTQREESQQGWDLWADCRFAFPRLKRQNRVTPALLHFYGLFTDGTQACHHGCERFPLERVAWTPKRNFQKGATSLALFSSTSSLNVQYNNALQFKSGGLRILERMDDNCSWAQHAGLAACRDFFTWRPVPGAAANFLARCCTRRKLSLPLALLVRLLGERRLPLADLQGVQGLEHCGSWSHGSDGTDLVPGGVIVVPIGGASLEESIPEAAIAHAGLLSRTELLVLGSLDLRQRCLELLKDC